MEKNSGVDIAVAFSEALYRNRSKAHDVPGNARVLEENRYLLEVRFLKAFVFLSFVGIATFFLAKNPQKVKKSISIPNTRIAA